MISPHRIFIKIKDIQVLEGSCQLTAIRIIKKIKEKYETDYPTIKNYADFRQQNENYIIEKMTEMKLI